jgi:hypothetical protein
MSADRAMRALMARLSAVLRPVTRPLGIKPLGIKMQIGIIA